MARKKSRLVAEVANAEAVVVTEEAVEEIAEVAVVKEKAEGDINLPNY